MAQIRTPAPPAGDDTELIAVVPMKRRSLAAKLAVIAAAVLGLVVVAGIVVAVLTMSDESTRPLLPVAPLTPISTPEKAVSTTPEPSSTEVAPPAPSFAPLPPITATAQTLAPTGPPAPSDQPRIRDRLHELFPRLFPETP